MSHGPCHCGCGKAAPVAKRTWKHRGWEKGQPIRFIHGHFQPVHREAGWSRVGVPIEQVRPDLDTLKHIYGTWKRVGQVLGTHPDVLYHWRKRARFTSWATAQRIRMAAWGNLKRRPDLDEIRIRNTAGQRRRREGIKNGTWVRRGEAQ